MNSKHTGVSWTPEEQQSTTLGKAYQGYQSLTKVFSNPSNDEQKVLDFIRFLEEDQQFELLFTLLDKDSIYKPWVIEVIRKLLQTPQTVIAVIPPNVFIQRWAFLSDPNAFTDKEMISLLKIQLESANLIDYLTSNDHEFDHAKASLYLEVFKQVGGDNDSFKKWCEKAFKSLDMDTWDTLLSLSEIEDDDLLNLIITFIQNGNSIYFGNTLKDSIRKTAEAIINGSLTETILSNHYTTLANCLNPSDRNAFQAQLLGLAAPANISVNQLFMDIFGEDLLEAFASARDYNDSVDLWTKAIANKDTILMTWLSESIQTNDDVFKSYKPDQKEHFRNRVQEKLTPDIDPESPLTKIASFFNLEIPKPIEEVASEDTEAEA
jgi:hypothetical protein